MAVTEEIAWGDGTSDKIYITADALEGNQVISISSDANTGVERTKTVTFSASGVSPVILTVVQSAGGPVPVFYDYLLFDGTAYIDTDIVPPENFSVAVNVGYQTLRAAQRYFGVYSTGGGTYLFEGSSTTNTDRVVEVYYDSSSYLVTRTVSQAYISYSFFVTPQRVGAGDSSTAFTKGEGAPNASLVLGALPSYSGQMFTGGFGNFYIFDSDAQNETSRSGLISNHTPFRTLRPCIYNGQDGFWNVEENKFYGNSAGSGTLTAAKISTKVISSYDTSNYSYASVLNMSSAYEGYNSTTIARINLKTGKAAETYVYFKFDTSSIPEDATIFRIFCTAKIGVSTVNGNMISSRQMRLYSGTTAKGTAVTVSATSATMYRIEAGTWTREELRDARLRVYAKRGPNGYNSNYYYSFYGATLFILYR